MPYALDAHKEGKRKTVNLLDMIEEVNRRNRESTCKPEIREGWNCMLETLLHFSNVYAGFGYYSAENVPEGEKPGIVRNGNPDYTGNPPSNPHIFPDETRRFYYVHRHLTKGKKRS